MSGVARSQVLLHYQGTGPAGSPQFICPADRIVLVKSAILSNQTDVVQKAYLRLSAAGGTMGIDVAVLDMAAWESAIQEGWFVLNPGDAVYVQHDGGLFRAWISGAVLIGVPLVPPAELADPVIYGPVVDDPSKQPPAARARRR